MHWGHAVSPDLLHWEEWDTALFPDEFGTEFSGCAFVDKENRTGLGSAEQPPVLFYYTAAGGTNRMSRGVPFTQRLAWSTDGCRTLQKRDGAVLEHIVGGNRDPKVVWAPELNAYLMILYLDGNAFALFSSTDLLSWTQFQTLTLEGEAECPNILRMPVQGSDDWKWVIFGATGIYVVGSLQDGRFVVEQDVQRPNDSTASYAGQLFDGLSPERAVLIDWVRADCPEPRFSQAMSLPMELELEYAEGRYFLLRKPIALDALTASQATYTTDLTEPRTQPLSTRACEIRICADCPADATVTLTAFGRSVILNAAENKVTTGNTKRACRLSYDGKRLQATVIVDACLTEVYTDGGRYAFTAGVLSDYNLPSLTVSSTAPLPGATVTVRELTSIWKEQQA
jgi:sucrose-6-phosphate hydrolase SacC (GH32 family)